MSAPRRIQLRREKGWRKPEGAVVVARPTKWGNPWSVTYHDGAWWLTGPFSGLVPSFATEALALGSAVAHFGQYVMPHGYRDLRPTWTLDDVDAELRAKVLACWCPLNQPCHADVLLELANA